jgi:hypothetical protein
MANLDVRPCEAKEKPAGRRFGSHYNRRSKHSTIRSAALPSHSGGMAPFFHCPAISRARAGGSLLGSVPINSLVPIVMVSGRLQNRRLFGDPTGIRDHAFGVFHQVVEFEVAERIDIMKLRRPAVEFPKIFRGPWVNGKDHGQSFRAVADGAQQIHEIPLSINVCRSMKRHDEKPAWVELQRLPTSRGSQARHVLQQGVDHRVADKKDLPVGHPGTTQIVTGRFARRKKPVGDGVGHHPIDLLMHRPIA